jgi:hypothetical protein
MSSITDESLRKDSARAAVKRHFRSETSLVKSLETPRWIVL